MNFQTKHSLLKTDNRLMPDIVQRAPAEYSPGEQNRVGRIESHPNWATLKEELQ